MTNLELMLDICTNRKAVLKKLFTGLEIELFDQNIRQAPDKQRSEEVAELFIKTYNARVTIYNNRVEAYNNSIHNGTHPALGKWVLGDILDDIKGIFD